MINLPRKPYYVFIFSVESNVKKSLSYEEMIKKYATKENKKKGIKEMCQTISKKYIVMFLGFTLFISFFKMQVVVIYFIILKKSDFCAQFYIRNVFLSLKSPNIPQAPLNLSHP